MKGIIRKCLSGVIIGSLLLGSVPAFAAGEDYSRDITIKVDGRVIQQTDQKAFIKNGRTMVPLRVVMEGLNFQVDWKKANRSIAIKNTKKDSDYVFYADRKTFDIRDVKGSRRGTLDVPPYVTKKNRTVMPLRVIAETYGQVNWNGATSTVEIIGNGNTNQGGFTPEGLPILKDTPGLIEQKRKRSELQEKSYKAFQELRNQYDGIRAPEEEEEALRRQFDKEIDKLYVRATDSEFQNILNAIDSADAVNALDMLYQSEIENNLDISSPWVLSAWNKDIAQTKDFSKLNTYMMDSDPFKLKVIGVNDKNEILIDLLSLSTEQCDIIIFGDLTAVKDKKEYPLYRRSSHLEGSYMSYAIPKNSAVRDYKDIDYFYMSISDRERKDKLMARDRTHLDDSRYGIYFFENPLK